MTGASSITASKPTQEEEELRANFRLSLIEGVGPKILACLLDRFGSPQAVLSANRSELRRVAGVGDKLVRRILEPPPMEMVEEELAACKRAGIAVISHSQAEYPSPLREIHDPPSLLFCQGAWLARDALALAIVGSRHATPYGFRIAERLAASLARAGFTIVSGLARGIDAAAHRGAIQAQGRTIAVLGGGRLRLYPPEHEGLALEVERCGAVISEHPPQIPPRTGSFPQRNRIISGLSQGVIVVEAPENSGSLITARLAMEQNRTVFAVPGPVDSRASRGCHKLLKDGAILVENADDVLAALGPLPAPAPVPCSIEKPQSAADSAPPSAIQHPAELLLNPLEKEILALVGNDVTLMDSIIEKSGLPAHQVLAIMSVLEVRRLVRRIGGQRVARP